MNFTKQVLSLMEDGKSYTAAELRDLTGADSRLIANALRNIKKFGYVEIIAPREQSYSINDAGRHRIAVVPPEVQSKKERERLKTANRRARLKAEQQAKAPIKPQPPKVDLVSLAMRTRPALDMAWMSVAREQEASHV
jgi:DNA-binding PadR family transcriptional regulator